MNRQPAPTASAAATAPIGPASRYLTDRQVGQRYNVSRACVWRWAAAGVIPRPIKIAPNTTRWDLYQLERAESERAGAAA